MRVHMQAHAWVHSLKPNNTQYTHAEGLRRPESINFDRQIPWLIIFVETAYI